MKFRFGQSVYFRHVETILKRYKEIFPAICITGPRQSGKTTIAKSFFPEKPYMSLEDPDVRLQAQTDPRGFLQTYSKGAIFDEVQRVPELLSYLQGMIDDDRNNNGRFILTGSQNFLLIEKITQSLAGRVGMITLLPMSLAEISQPDRTVEDKIFYGGYPGLFANQMDPTEFYPSYIQTYLERDIRQIKNVSDLDSFQKFLALCAGRIGQIVNLTSLAQDAQISNTTAKQWLTVLEASYLVFQVTPYFRNFSKRLVKSPKIYFYDTGLACQLLKIQKAEQLQTHYLKGGLFENLAILEVFKSSCNKGQLQSLHFWRDKTGNEVDLVHDTGGKMISIEIKASQTFNPDYLKNLNYLKGLWQVRQDQVQEMLPILLYSGKTINKFLGVQVVGIDDWWQNFENLHTVV